MKQRLILFINPHRAVAEERIVFSRNIQIGHRLISADIHRADDNAAPTGRLQRLAENIIELGLGRRAGPVHIQHFGAEQTYRLRPVIECHSGFNGVRDICRHLQTQAVFGLPFLIQPRLLLAMHLRLNPGLLLIIARDRLIGIDHQQPGVAVDMHRLADPGEQRVHIDANQRGNIKRTRQNHGMRGGPAAAQQQAFEQGLVQFKKLAGR